MLKRIAISGFAGFIVATFLFSMMQTLIAMGDVDLDKSKGPKVIDFVRLKRSSQTEMKKSGSFHKRVSRSLTLSSRR